MSTVYEIDFSSGKLIPKKRIQDLKLGQVIYITGNMYAPAENFVICEIDNKDSERFGINYFCIGTSSFTGTWVQDHMFKAYNDDLAGKCSNWLYKEEFKPELIKQLEINYLAKEKKAEEEKQKAKRKHEEYKEELKKKYSYLELTSNSNKSSRIVATKNIRKELKKAFPGFKFSITSECFSGGDSIRVEWTDGPTDGEVSKIIDKYSAGSFNGYEDIYEYKSNGFNELFGDAKYVQSTRKYSDDVRNSALLKFGMTQEEINRDYNKSKIVFGDLEESSFYCRPESK